MWTGWYPPEEMQTTEIEAQTYIYIYYDIFNLSSDGKVALRFHLCNQFRFSQPDAVPRRTS